MTGSQDFPKTGPMSKIRCRRFKKLETVALRQSFIVTGGGKKLFYKFVDDA